MPSPAQAPPGRAKRSYDPDGMRRRVLEVAAAAFQAQGYHATSMHEVIRSAGATGGAVYHHFPTKKALGLAVIEERVAGEIERTWLRPVEAAASARAGILAAFHAVASALDSRQRVEGCPLTNLALELALIDPAFRTAIDAQFERWRSVLAKRIAEDADFAGIDAEAFATFVVAAFTGALAQAKARQDTGPLTACARELERTMPGAGAPSA